MATPGFVNSHHHLYQWITRGYATNDTLFGWLTTLYPIWARLTPELVTASAAANLANVWLELRQTLATLAGASSPAPGRAVKVAVKPPEDPDAEPGPGEEAGA